MYPFSYYTKGGLYANEKKVDLGAWLTQILFRYAKATNSTYFPKAKFQFQDPCKNLFVFSFSSHKFSNNQC